MKKKTEEVEPTQLDRSPNFSVTEIVELSLPVKESSIYQTYYHQTATTEDLWRFLQEVERKFGKNAPINIRGGRVAATETNR